jgi:hypothetical protein
MYFTHVFLMDIQKVPEDKHGGMNDGSRTQSS